MASAYPATFPWENDGWHPPYELPGADLLAELDVEDNDIGGFAAIAYKHCNPFEWVPTGKLQGGKPCGTPVARTFYQFFTIYMEDIRPLNCTSESSVTTEGPLKGSFTGTPQVCESDKCCLGHLGFPLYNREWESNQEKWDDRVVKFGCTWLNHEAYCMILFQSLDWCHGFYDRTLEKADVMWRPVAHPCFSLFTFFLSQCSNFKTSGAKAFIETLQIEPEDYMNTLSAMEANVVPGMFFQNDHVCVPMSEVDPALFAVGGSMDNGMNTGAAPSTPAATPETPAATPETPAATPTTPAATPDATPAASTPAAGSGSFAVVPSVVFMAVGLFAGLF